MFKEGEESEVGTGKADEGGDRGEEGEAVDDKEKEFHVGQSIDLGIIYRCEDGNFCRGGHSAIGANLRPESLSICASTAVIRPLFLYAQRALSPQFWGLKALWAYKKRGRTQDSTARFGGNFSLKLTPMAVRTQWICRNTHESIGIRMSNRGIRGWDTSPYGLGIN
jgi:hypothetical protein